MIECVFTIDYEIYGSGEGSLNELIYEPAKKLIKVFEKHDSRLVFFVEVAELEIIEANGADLAINQVIAQLKELYEKGFELGLHLHPQWYNARYENRRWILDYREYNLCVLSKARIVQMVDRGIAYLRKILDNTHFTPVSYRGGNWLFQPTQPASSILASRGLKVDSSVFKGGLQNQHHLDYRPARKNGYYWRFKADANLPDPQGLLLEIPIYTQMVPPWKMFSPKRYGLQQKGGLTAWPEKKRLRRFRDFVRFSYPMKLDFCRMTLRELIQSIERLVREDQQNPESFRPIVTIGHTKELIDTETIDSFLSYLKRRGIRISSFEDVYYKCK